MNKMGLWKTTKTSNGNQKTEIDTSTLLLRLQCIIDSQSAEVMQLAIQSMIEELEERE